MNSYFSLVNVIAAAINFLALLGTIFLLFRNRKSRSHQENKTVASSSRNWKYETNDQSRHIDTDQPVAEAPPHNVIDDIGIMSPIGTTDSPADNTSSQPEPSKYHVFPSFHGPDVRKVFLSHVLKEFKRKGINAFVHNDMERSKSIGPEIIKAIRGSRIAIVILSENYASSTWCLNELVEIMDCREKLDKTVMPIFYEVDPTHIKKQTGEFGKVFTQTCEGKTKENIGRWKHALTEVAQMAGYHSTNRGNDTEMIQDIATNVLKKLNNSAPSSDLVGLVGMKSQMTKMEPLLRLDSDEVRMIGILGQSGIGKTTIARYLFNQHSRDFQLSVFMESIKTRYAISACSDSVKLDLQYQFMFQLTNDVGIKIPHLGVAEDRLKDKKVLVVLDDVDQSVQLEAMARENWFGPGSRIIVTTQDQMILTVGGIKHIHKVDLPSDDEALQMFCMYAFGQKLPKDGFKELASEVISLVGELPLGLRVMGSYFQGRCKEDWRKALPSLKTHFDQNGEIMRILKFSYDALCDEDKILFLLIACFFKDERVDIVEGCLASCFSDTQGLHVLAEKSLIDVDGGIIKMQELLVQLGRKIERDQSVSDPGKRQFLDVAVDIRDVLNNDKIGSSSVVGINDLDGNITCTSETVFERLWLKRKKRLSNLQFLRICSDGINPRSLNSISGNLRFLSWRNFRMRCFPSSFNPKFLVKLDMRKSSLKKLWEGTQQLDNLKWMDLSRSESLKELPDLSFAINLYELNLSHCSSLVKLPSSIGGAINLQKLNLCSCKRLVELPSSMRNLRRLSTFTLDKCSKLEVLLTNINLESLIYLDLSECSLLKSYSESSTNIQDLKPSGTTVTEAPSSEMCEIQELGPWIGRTSCLRRLVLSRMKNLVSLPQLPYSVVHLEADNCESLERLDCSFRNPGIRLDFRNCFKLNQEARDLIIQTPTNQYAVLPGEVVPQCFTYRSSGGTLPVKLNQKPLGTSTKFKACIICAGKFWGKANISCRITSKENALTYYKKIEGVFRGNLYTFEVEAEEVTSTELVFEFQIRRSDLRMRFQEAWEIEKCGVLQIM